METLRVKCNSCDKDYKTKANLKKHVATKHKIVELDEDFPEDEVVDEVVEELDMAEAADVAETEDLIMKEFFLDPTPMEPIFKEPIILEEPINSVCMVCHQEFPRLLELNLHISTHHPPTPTLTCTICPFTTKLFGRSWHTQQRISVA